MTPLTAAGTRTSQRKVRRSAAGIGSAPGKPVKSPWSNPFGQGQKRQWSAWETSNDRVNLSGSGDDRRRGRIDRSPFGKSGRSKCAAWQWEIAALKQGLRQIIRVLGVPSLGFRHLDHSKNTHRIPSVSRFKSFVSRSDCSAHFLAGANGSHHGAGATGNQFHASQDCRAKN